MFKLAWSHFCRYGKNRKISVNVALKGCFAKQEKKIPVMHKQGMHKSTLLAVILFDRHQVKIYSFVSRSNHLLY